MDVIDPSRPTGVGNRMSPRREFALRFDALYVAGGSPPLRLLASAARKRAHVVKGSEAATSVSAQRISDWKTGRNVPARFEVLLPVLLVLIDGARRRGQTSRVELVNLRAWKHLWAQAQAIRSPRAAVLTSCPFPGPAAYTRADVHGFTGREVAIGQLVRMVTGAATASGAVRIIALTGASGVGKTSLLEAGLVPALEARKPRGWTVQTIVLGADPLQSLLPLLGDRIERRGMMSESRSDSNRLIIIDQFERLFAQGLDRDTTELVLAQIRRLAANAVVLISLRTCRIAECGEYPLLVDTLRHRAYTLPPMTSSGLRTVITDAARRQGITVEAGLEEVLLAAIGGIRGDGGRLGHEPGELAMVARTLAAMWPYRSGTRFTIDGYRRIGGIEGVAHTAADELWNAFSPAQRRIARRILLGLVAVRGDADDTRRRASHDDLRRLLGGEPTAPAVLDALINARLVIMERGTAYLGHDLLLTWPRLAEWTERERPALLIRGQTAADASEWLAMERDPSLLYRGMRLAIALQHIDPTDDVVSEFLRESSLTQHLATASVYPTRRLNHH